MIALIATYKGLQVMDTDKFCGETCHKVMQPEAVAHRVRPTPTSAASIVTSARGPLTSQRPS